ncbi:MAG: DMT family transporter [Acidobacteria bacterium]|nr:DMT family transporter [Acidobacteriota bacterium]
MSPSPAAVTYGLLLLAVACVSLGSILIRGAAAPPLTVSFYRVFLASIVLAPFALRQGRTRWPALSLPQRRMVVLCGFALALHFATWIASLSYTSVAASVLLVNTAPLFTVALARLFLHETPTPAVLAAVGLAVGGAGLIAAGDWSAGPAPLFGDLLAVAGALMLSVYHVIGRGLRGALPLDAYLLVVWSTAAGVLAVLALAAGSPLSGLAPRTWGLLLALALIPTLAGHGLVNRSLRHLPAPVVGLFLLGEPLGSSVLAYSVFGEVPGAWTIAGGAVVLVALALVVLAGGR